MRRLELAEGEEILQQEFVDAWVDKRPVRGEVVITNHRVVLRVSEPRTAFRWSMLLPVLLRRVVDQSADLPVRVTADIARDDFESATPEGTLVHVRSRGTGYAATWFTCKPASAPDFAAQLRRWSSGDDPRPPDVDVPGAKLVKG